MVPYGVYPLHYNQVVFTNITLDLVTPPFSCLSLVLLPISYVHGFLLHSPKLLFFSLLLPHLSFIKNCTKNTISLSSPLLFILSPLHSSPLLSSPLLFSPPQTHTHIILLLISKIKFWFSQQDIHNLTTLSAFQLVNQSINNTSWEYEHTTKTYHQHHHHHHHQRRHHTVESLTTFFSSSISSNKSFRFLLPG
ncbi:hypothetical protein EYC84_008645 [Monilinia fructicola]|uniref:Uncharacterized protein n=1 Tax=Monilinia fructicola TaxID=38448 RepID=A0A5M9JKK2_MONFR|nr:hypothetical protein EYC84_008645 [Monilinia fructicola]